MHKATITTLFLALSFGLQAQFTSAENPDPNLHKALEVQLGAGFDYFIFAKVSGHVNYFFVQREQMRIGVANEVAFTHFLIGGTAFWYPAVKVENKLPGGFWLTSSAGPEWSRNLELPQAFRMEWLDEEEEGYNVDKAIHRNSTRIDVGLKKYVGRISWEFSTPLRFGQRLDEKWAYYPGIQTKVGWSF